MNLQSDFGYYIITQTLNIALCLLAGRNLRTDKRTDRQTIGRLLDAPRLTFQAGGIKKLGQC